MDDERMALAMRCLACAVALEQGEAYQRLHKLVQQRDSLLEVPTFMRPASSTAVEQLVEATRLAERAADEEALRTLRWVATEQGACALVEG